MQISGFRLLVLLLCLVGPVTAAHAQPGVIVLRTPNQLPAQKGQSSSVPSTSDQINANTFVQDPSFTTIKAAPAGYQLGKSTQDIFIACIDLFTLQIIPNCNVKLAATRQFGSGGHLHGDPNGNDGAIAVGSFNPTSGNTGTQGFLQTTFTASEASGTTNVLITGSTQDGRPIIPTQIFMLTQIHDDQVAIPPSGPGFTVSTASSGHDNNNIWLTGSTLSDFVDALVNFQGRLDDLFNGKVIGATLPVTATNLPQGGVFDFLNHNWLPPHASHRYGRDMDIGTWTPQGVPIIPLNQRPSLAAGIEDAGFSMPVPNESFDGCALPPCDLASRHWHLRDGY
jgi:hypothetical protein